MRGTSAAPRIILVAVVLALLAALTAFGILALGPFHSVDPAAHLLAIAGMWALFAVAVLLLRRVPARAVAPLVLAGALATGVAALPGPPETSTDAARYAWDGIVFDAGFSPYRYVPASVDIAQLRTAWLFPAPRVDPDGTVHCPDRYTATTQVGSRGELCTVINRPHVPTIYPPVAEAAFALVRLPVPPTVMYLPVQLLGLVVALATSGLLLAGLARRGLDPRRAALYAWCPLVASEAVNNAHIDALAVLLTLAASLLVAGGRPVRGGLVLGLAIATKFTPVLAAPSLVRRRGVRMMLAAVGTVVAVYVPFVVWTGPQVVGYLPGYLNEEGYDSGSRSALLGLLLPGAASTVVAVLLVAAVAVAVVLRGDPVFPWPGQLAVAGVALLLLSPRYSWYGLLLLPPLAMTGRWEWFAVPLAFVPIYLVGRSLPVPLLVLAAAVVVAVGTIVRHAATRRLNLGTG